MASFFNKITSTVTGGHDETQSKEQTLTSILSSHEDRTDFLLLLANSIGLMRLQVLDTFDPERSGDNWNHKLRAESGKSTVTTQERPHAGPQSDTDADEIEEQRREEYERRVEELSSPEMVVLKEEAIEHFDSWREMVIQRIGEVINEEHGGDDTKSTQSSSSEQQAGQTADVLETMADSQTDLILRQWYPPQETPLRKLPQPQRVLILHSLLLILLSLKTYTAESRVLMLYVTSSLGLPLKLLAEDESHVAAGLLESAEQQINADAETKQKADENASSRKWKVGLGAAAGAVLIGVTGGLAAPLLAAGVGSIMGGIGLASTATAGYLGALAGSAPLVGALFGAYGGRMTGRIVDQYAREVEDFAFIPLHPQRQHILGKHDEEHNRHLRVAIGISGYLTEESEVVRPWEVLGSSIEGFALRWELKTLLSLGNALTTYIKSYAWGWAKKEIISRTVFATLASAIGSALSLPYGITKAAKLVDNPFSLAKSRSDKAGKVLAHALINKVQGERPVTLLGYSLGARVIYSCLEELAHQQAFGLVESVVLAGAPTPSDSVAWRRMRSVVTGRLINVYSTNDYLLAFLYRTSSLQYGIAGLQAISEVPGIENFDVSEFVDGHTQYRFMIIRILQKVGLEDIDAAEVEKQMKQMQQLQKRAEEEQAKVKSEGKGKSPENEATEMEREIAEKNAAAAATASREEPSTLDNRDFPDIGKMNLGSEKS